MAVGVLKFGGGVLISFLAHKTSSCHQKKMDIFDGLRPQCVDSTDLDDSDTSKDSDMEVIEQLVDPSDEDTLSRLIVDIGESEELGETNVVLNFGTLRGNSSGVLKFGVVVNLGPVPKFGAGV